MSLEDIKKLKVVELRAKLRERGLDWKGLKAELVARLISAAEARLEEKGSSSTEAPQRTAVPPDHDEGLLEEPHPQPEEGGHPSPAHQADQSTQTETEPRACNPPCSCSGRRQEQPTQPDSEEPSKEKVRADSRPFSETSPESQPAGQGGFQQPRVSLAQEALPLPDDGVSPTAVTAGPQLSCTPHTPEVDQFSEAPGAEVKNIQRQCEEKGRDYYEFKEEIQYNRAKTPEPGPESENEMEVDDDDDVVRLDSYNSDLHFELGVDGCSGQPLLWEKFPLLQSGCRLTHGFTQGKVGFEVKFVKKLSAAAVDIHFDPEPHVLRVGWSVDSTSFQLGEEELSYGVDGVGKAVTGGISEEFGEPFSEGDVIGCYAFISKGGDAELLFHKNGCSLGVAFRISSSTLAGRALYPHILCKNCSVSLNLDPEGTVWYHGPPGYCPLPVLPSTQRIRGPQPPPHRKDCEVLMMVGMPGSGKSHWVWNYVARNPKKHYNVLSTNTILPCMRLPGSEHKELLLQHATQCLTHLIRIASNKRRNFILDQANIYASARKHKMLRFRGYQRRAVVVVPSDAEWKRRLQQQEEGMGVPKISLLKSKASFTLPEQGELLEEVLFVELCQEEVQRLLTTYKEEARRVLPTPPKRKKHQNRHPKVHMNPCGRAYRWSQSSCGYHPYSQWRHKKPRGWHHSAFVQPYGCNSDPQRYRDYYQPCSGQWNTCDQSQGYYNNQDYYFGNQGFW